MIFFIKMTFLDLGRKRKKRTSIESTVRIALERAFNQVHSYLSHRIVNSFPWHLGAGFNLIIVHFYISRKFVDIIRCYT